MTAEVDGTGWRVPAPSAAGAVGVGPLEVTVGAAAPWPSWTWSVANRSDRPVSVRRVALAFSLEPRGAALRMFRHGYQSWSSSGTAVAGVDRDPSSRGGAEMLRAAHHADQAVVEGDALRSEWFTLLTDGGGDPLLAAFEAATDHDGTLWLVRGPEGAWELRAEAFLGGAVMAPGETRSLHGILLTTGDDPAALLDGWARASGLLSGARVSAPYQVGWCSWYHYFHRISEEVVRSNLAGAPSWPFEVFQVDDGWQAGIGDWLSTSATFPRGLDALASSIRAAGYRAGLWLAPFLAAPDSDVARGHPDWMAGRVSSSGQTVPLHAWFNPTWGGGRGGRMFALDTSNPEVIEHLESVGRILADIGFGYLKLDFTFAPSGDGVWSDPAMTPAARVRAGFDAIRRGAGDDCFILACGAPLSHVMGSVDAARIGADVAPLWSLDPAAEVIPGYLATQPATAHAWSATAARSFMHRRFWLNDPDCVMLRTKETDLTPEQAATWARAVGLSGGLALVSDDLALLDDDARRLLAEVVSLGRQADAAAQRGAPAVCPDLLDGPTATSLAAAGHVLRVDPATGRSDLASAGDR